MKKAKNEYAIQAVVNGLRVIEAFEHAEELGVTELSQVLGLHKNNVFRLLATLEMKDYIEQTEVGRYRLGSRCFEVARWHRRSAAELLRRAGEVLDALAESTGETVHLAVLRDFEVIHLDAREAAHLVRVGLRVGRRLPAHCTALGKVLLGCGGETVLREYGRWLGASGAPAKFTDATIVDRDKLFEHLQGVGLRRLAVDDEEFDAGVCCAAAPVFDDTGALVAALSVSAPTLRHGSESMLERVGPQVAAAAERLSARLGYSD